jgi:hypothetical protein
MKIKKIRSILIFFLLWLFLFVIIYFSIAVVGYMRSPTKIEDWAAFWENNKGIFFDSLSRSLLLYVVFSIPLLLIILLIKKLVNLVKHKKRN